MERYASDEGRPPGYERGPDLLRWHTEDRAAHLLPLTQPLAELAGRLLASHEGWDVQPRLHLRGLASLEVGACPETEEIVVEALWAEDHELRGTAAVEVRIRTTCPAPGADAPAGPPKRFVFVSGYPSHPADAPPDAPADASPDASRMAEILMTELVAEVEQKVREGLSG